VAGRRWKARAVDFCFVAFARDKYSAFKMPNNSAQFLFDRIAQPPTSLAPGL
jgi:hypothetical protein